MTQLNAEEAQVEVLDDEHQLPRNDAKKRRRQDSSIGGLTRRISSFFKTGSNPGSPRTSQPTLEAIDSVAFAFQQPEHSIPPLPPLPAPSNEKVPSTGGQTLRRALSARLRGITSSKRGDPEPRRASMSSVHRPVVGVSPDTAEMRSAQPAQVEDNRPHSRVESQRSFTPSIASTQESQHREFLSGFRPAPPATPPGTDTEESWQLHDWAPRNSMFVGRSTSESALTTLTRANEQPPTPPRKMSFRRLGTAKSSSLSKDLPSTPEIESWRAFGSPANRLDEIENRKLDDDVPTLSSARTPSPASDVRANEDHHNLPPQPDRPELDALLLPQAPAFDRLSAEGMLRDANARSRFESFDNGGPRQSSAAVLPTQNSGLGLAPGSPALVSPVWNGRPVTMASLANEMRAIAHLSAQPTGHLSATGPLPEASNRVSLISVSDTDTPLVGYKQLVVDTEDNKENANLFYKSPTQRSSGGANSFAGRYRSSSPSGSALHVDGHPNTTGLTPPDQAHLARSQLAKLNTRLSTSTRRSMTTPMTQFSQDGTFTSWDDAMSALDAQVGNATLVKVERLDKEDIREWAAGSFVGVARERNASLGGESQVPPRPPSKDDFELPPGLLAKLQSFPDVVHAVRHRSGDETKDELVKLGKIASKRARRSVSQPLPQSPLVRTPTAKPYLASRATFGRGRGRRRSAASTRRVMSLSDAVPDALSNNLPEALPPQPTSPAHVASPESKSAGLEKEQHTRSGTSHSRQRSSEQKTLSFRTSEEAARAMQQAQAERERREKEREIRKQQHRAERHAEKKKRDPLLAARLALVGLGPPVVSKEEIPSEPPSAVRSHFGEVPHSAALTVDTVGSAGSPRRLDSPTRTSGEVAGTSRPSSRTQMTPSRALPDVPLPAASTVTSTQAQVGGGHTQDETWPSRPGPSPYGYGRQNPSGTLTERSFVTATEEPRLPMSKAESMRSFYADARESVAETAPHPLPSPALSMPYPSPSPALPGAYAFYQTRTPTEVQGISSSPSSSWRQQQSHSTPSAASSHSFLAMYPETSPGSVGLASGSVKGWPVPPGRTLSPQVSTDGTVLARGRKESDGSVTKESWFSSAAGLLKQRDVRRPKEDERVEKKSGGVGALFGLGGSSSSASLNRKEILLPATSSQTEANLEGREVLSSDAVYRSVTGHRHHPQLVEPGSNSWTQQRQSLRASVVADPGALRGSH